MTDDPAAARREVEPHLLDFFRFNASPMVALASSERRAELAAKGFAHYASGALEALRDVTYAVGQGIALVGSPETVATRAAQLAREDCLRRGSSRRCGNAVNSRRSCRSLPEAGTHPAAGCRA